MTQKKLPFDYNLFLTGKYRVKTRDGREVKRLVHDGGNYYPLISDDPDEMWAADGSYHEEKHADHPLDLYLEEIGEETEPSFGDHVKRNMAIMFPEPQPEKKESLFALMSQHGLTLTESELNDIVACVLGKEEYLRRANEKRVFVNVYSDKVGRFISDEEWGTWQDAYDNRDQVSTYRETVEIIRKKTMDNMKLTGDVVHNTTTVRFGFWDKVKILLGKPLIVNVEIQTDNEEVFVVSTKSSSFVPSLITRKSKGGGEATEALTD